MLVAHHLLKLLDEAERHGYILENISIVPYANPIGLSQHLLGSHIGRFSTKSGVNFNREYMDIGEAIAKRIDGKLNENSAHNVNLIREALLAEIDSKVTGIEEYEMKRLLYKIASPCDIVIDLHCDSDAVLHMYTSDRLWPQISDLAAELKTECNLLAPANGFDSFDEACSCPWAYLADKFPSYPIPMGCEAVTVELRGESDVSYWNSNNGSSHITACRYQTVVTSQDMNVSRYVEKLIVVTRTTATITATSVYIILAFTSPPYIFLDSLNRCTMSSQ